MTKQQLRLGLILTTILFLPGCWSIIGPEKSLVKELPGESMFTMWLGIYIALAAINIVIRFVHRVPFTKKGSSEKEIYEKKSVSYLTTFLTFLIVILLIQVGVNPIVS